MATPSRHPETGTFYIRRQIPGALLVWSTAALLCDPVAAPHFWWVQLDIFTTGLGCALATMMQARLRDVAGEAQALAAALNHPTFTVANAIGPRLGAWRSRRATGGLGRDGSAAAWR